MATLSPMSVGRQPFAVLDSPRLQHLTSMKNRQHAIVPSKAASGKSSISGLCKMSPTFSSSPAKRPYSASLMDDFDSENIDPAMFTSPTKRSKCNDSTHVKPFFTLTTTPTSAASTKSSPASSMLPPSISSSRLQTPLVRNKANTSSPRAPLTAPAGRSLVSKRAIDVRARRVSAPFSRVDPPAFTRSIGVSDLPFSLAEALAGSISRPSPKQTAAKIEQSIPRRWFFDIHEDTADEEATNLMEHSTLTLDLSSDGEDGRRKREDKGKENTPPADYDAPAPRPGRTVSAPAGPAAKTRKAPLARHKVVDADAMDSGEERAPLSLLEPGEFYAQGLTQDSYIVVPAALDKGSEAAVRGGGGSATAESVQSFEAKMLAHKTRLRRSGGGGGGLAASVLDMPVVSASGDVTGDIIIWDEGCEGVVEDCALIGKSEGSSRHAEKRKRVLTEDDAAAAADNDENTAG